MKFEYDSTKAKGERVTKMEVNNNGTFEVIDPAKTYVIATNAFTAKGGDGLTPFETAYKAGRVTDLGLSTGKTYVISRNHSVKSTTRLKVASSIHQNFQTNTNKKQPQVFSIRSRTPAVVML